MIDGLWISGYGGHGRKRYTSTGLVRDKSVSHKSHDVVWYFSTIITPRIMYRMGILHLLLLPKASRIYSLECATHLRQLSALAQRRQQISSLISCHGQVSGRVCYPGLGSVSGHLCVQGCFPSRTRLSDDFDLCYFAMSYAAP